MFENEARELLLYLQIVTDFGEELRVEEAGGGLYAVIRPNGAGTMVYVGEDTGISMMFYELNGWEDGDEPVQTWLIENETELR